MAKAQISRSELSEQLAKASDRKMAEREKFIMLALEEPDRSATMMDLADWLELEVRFCRVASAYYADDIDSLDNGADDDLMGKIDSWNVAPRLYADYLRLIPSEDRDQEKIVHAALKGFKLAMKDTMSELRKIREVSASL